MNSDRFKEWVSPSYEGPMIIAGPCSAESESQLLSTAEALSSRGIRFFRAGVWKPRTHPYSFEGAGDAALEWLGKVRSQTGMKVSTEVASSSHVEKALKAGVDFLWVGARTTTNPFMVQEIADALKGTDVPVLIKNPVMPDLELWLGAIERFSRAGISKIGAVHRGIAMSGRSLYRNSPQWQMAIGLRMRCPELMILCDPSHMGGARRYVKEISQKALDLDFDGLFIESHIDPDCALSDSAQQLTPDALGDMLSELVIRTGEPGNSADGQSIEQLRARIDELDDTLLSVLAARMEVSAAIGEYKLRNNISILQSGRWDNVLSHVLSRGEEYGLDRDFVSGVFSLIHQASIDRQNEIVNPPDKGSVNE